MLLACYYVKSLFFPGKLVYLAGGQPYLPGDDIPRLPSHT